MGGVGKIDIRDVEEVMIWVLVWGERMVEMEGNYTCENLIYEYLGVIRGVWEVN